MSAHTYEDLRSSLLTRAGHCTVYGDSRLDYGRLDYGRLDIRREEVRYIRQISRYGTVQSPSVPVRIRYTVDRIHRSYCYDIK